LISRAIRNWRSRTRSRAKYIVNQDAATVKLDQALVEGARLNLDYTDIISPVDGIVVSRNVTGGQTVASTFQTPTLFLVAKDLKQLEVDTNTSEADMGGVKEGDKATFTVDAFPQRVFTRHRRAKASIAIDRAECRDLRRRHRGQ
jgi:HlyD family secretion protein